MTKNRTILTATLILLAAILLIVVFTPLEYKNIQLFWRHFWITFGLGIIVTFQRVKSKPNRVLARVLYLVFTPIFALIFLFSRYTDTSGDIDTIPIQGSNKVILTRFYTLFMAGNPRNEMSLGYSLLGGNLVWRTGAIYEKNGLGDVIELEIFERYDLPRYLYERENVFILRNEGYVVDCFEDEVYSLNPKK